jgi:uncharacterized membrane protein SpoIIM required for sporulation
MDLDAFVTEHAGEWNRLQYLVGRPARRRSAAEVDEMVMLYRRTATHLSVVRSRWGDPTIVAWLTRLVLQARAAVSPSAGFSVASVRRFFAVAFPTEVYRAGRWCLGTAAAFLAFSVVVGYFVATDPSIAATVLTPEEIESYVSRDFEAYYSQSTHENFAAQVWLNNTILSAACLASGILVLPVLYILYVNALNIGLAGGIMVGNGGADTFFGLITVHGLLELTCVLVAAGVGLRVGWAWIAPGPYLTRTQSLARAGRSATVVALGLGVWLLISGIVEGFVTPSPLPVVVKLVLGALVWLAFLSYVVIVGGAAVRQGEHADVAAYEREVEAPSV